MSPSERRRRPANSGGRPPSRRDPARPTGASRARPATTRLRTARRAVVPLPARSGRLRFADLFAGIGGFHLAFARLGAGCVFAAENDPAARLTYEANFRPSCPELFSSGSFARDVEQVETASVPDFDVLCAGFPCQPFSLAGKHRGFDDPRGTLFFHIVRILGDKRPAAFFLENVPGLASHDGGRTFRIMERLLTRKLGYSLHTRVVRACDFNLPQLRPRLFMVGFSQPERPFAFPEPVPLTTSMDDVFGGKCHRQIGYTVLASGYGKGFGTRRAWDAYLVDGELRRVGPREARIMQGFPDDFILPDSHRQAMRQLGNAVAVPAVEATARQIAASLGFPEWSADQAVRSLDEAAVPVEPLEPRPGAEVDSDVSR